MAAGQSKEKLRKRLCSRRARISGADFMGFSREITVELQQQPEYRSASVIHCYVSMNDRREVNTHVLIKMMIEQGKRVVVPVTHFEDERLSHIGLRSFDDLRPNKWGVLEPKSGRQAEPGALDLVIVPMVGGDERGHRIGYGGGYYDRFLKGVSCPTIGLCFEQNIVSCLPTEDYDVPLDKIITEKRIIYRQ
ncbi:5-formyltetrahydrofolate cyclo-ligase [Fodinibius sediminis]|uniref:5-formyltetrahydrofolate cyclo-ligase n=1 Tax=Fodinibius sediminis TaxID=1214077 RepID=A0A521B2I1_9BACT|nr:5-formyltetrahydrofolate cyclo-ligase [Fodinibius sediminis]SMO41245.1 5-formyltetrahydrofolate cyclo-ligase [Fodinibius sediminis]